MLARNETIFKWALYAGATAVFFLLQGAVLQRITLWGVIPFVFPILVAVLGMYEGPLPASVYALTVGVLCDLLLPASIPCFYTLIFQKLHCINCQFICFLCSQPSYCQYSLSTVCITKSAWKLCLSADFLPVDQIVKYQSFIPAFRIHIIKHRLYFSGYRKNPVKIQITISVQFSGITGVFIIYM